MAAPDGGDARADDRIVDERVRRLGADAGSDEQADAASGAGTARAAIIVRNGEVAHVDEFRRITAAIRIRPAKRGLSLGKFVSRDRKILRSDDIEADATVYP